MTFAGARRARRRPSLTPMIDVVFLLLVFFMLASRFGLDAVIPLPLGGGGGAYTGAPRLVQIGPDSLRLNGVPVGEAALPEALHALMESEADPVILRADEGTDLQRVVTLSDGLRAAGIARLVLVE